MRATKKSLLILTGLALAISVIAKDKPWTEWTVKDAKKILNESGWGQTQTYIPSSSDSSRSTTTAGSTGSSTAAGTKGGLVDEVPGVNYRVRFLSAKPIRQAFLRIVQLDPKATPEQKDQGQLFVDSKYDKTVVIAVSYDQEGLPKDSRLMMSVFQAFSNASTSVMKNNAYLDMKGGQRVFLQEYKPPSGDGMGAIFVFPRMVNDKPILDPKAGGDVRLYAEFTKPSGSEDFQVRLSVRFKLSEMMYDGLMEY